MKNLFRFENSNSRKFIINRIIIGIILVPIMFTIMLSLAIYTIATITVLPIFGIVFFLGTLLFGYGLLNLIKNLTSPIKGTSHRFTNKLNQLSKTFDTKFNDTTKLIINKVTTFINYI